MSRDVVASSSQQYQMTHSDDKEFVTMHVGGQLLGISVLAVQDVLRAMPRAEVPLSPPVIAGLLNIRGRIVTAIDMYHRLGISDQKTEESVHMNVVVEYHNELYSLVVDSVGDVHKLPMAEFEKCPANLAPQWREVAAGVFKLEGELLVILDVENVLGNLTK